jgi:4-hydroxy-2-oxoheptanedioate aldolase
MKYPPVGMRSYGPHRAATLRGVSTSEYFATANGETLSLAMIETRGALKALDAILADEGIDGVFVGPADLSLQISGGSGIDVDRADNLAAIDHVVARALAARKIPAIFAPTARHARLYADKGYRFVAVGTDSELLAIGARTLLTEARGQTKAAPPGGDAASLKNTLDATAY